jgi:hypothetical protein
MIRHRSILGLGAWLLLVFASGVLVGVFGQRLYSAKVVNAGGGRRAGRPSPEEFRKHYVADMERRLKLNEQQVQQVNQILDETRVRFDAVREKLRGEMKPIQEDQQSRIRAILDPAQQAEYAKMLVEREQEQERRRQGK